MDKIKEFLNWLDAECPPGIMTFDLSHGFAENLRNRLDTILSLPLQEDKDEYLSLFNQFVRFAIFTFENASPMSSLEKLDEEIKEVAHEIQHGHKDLAEEYADCIMCILDSAARMNIFPFDLQKAFARKLKINQARVWVKNDNNTYSHLK